MPEAFNEEWRPVPGHEGAYSVSNLGRVRSEPRVITRSNGWKQTIPERIMRTPLNQYGYPHIRLAVTGRGRHAGTRLVHHLVLEAFVGPRPFGTVCCHNDGDASNPRLDNLRWDTAAANSADSIKHGVLHRGERAHSSRLNAEQVLAIRADTRSHTEIARAYGVTQPHVSRIKSRHVWTHI
jgi:hypothetical protein